MRESPVYLIGSRYSHHAGHSGYEGFSRYIGVPVKTSIKTRFQTSHLGWRIDRAITSLTSRSYYSWPLLRAEAVMAFHMLSHRNALYHAIYGDTDLWLLPKIKHVTTNRLIATFHDPPSILKWLGLDKVTAELDAAILVSESQRRFFEELISAERIFVIPHGVDSEFFKPAANPIGHPICITVGSKLRDFETLTQAADLILRTNPHVRFIAVGARRPGGGNPQLHDARFEFLDDLSDQALVRAYQSSKIAIFSFRDATANNALLEAMACGLPVVATDVGGVRDYLTPDEGFLCEPANPAMFAEAVLNVLKNPLLASQMSQASRLRALQYDYRTTAEKMQRVYAQVLDKNKN